MRIRSICCLVLTVLLAGAVAFAGNPSTELGFSGSFEKHKETSSTWRIDGEFLAPIGGDHLKAGPTVSIHDDADQTAAGAAIELNFFGSKLGPFGRAAGSYLIREPDAGDRHSVAAGAGLKFPVGSSGLIKVWAERVVDGRGKDVADYDVLAGIVIRI